MQRSISVLSLVFLISLLTVSSIGASDINDTDIGDLGTNIECDEFDMISSDYEVVDESLSESNLVIDDNVSVGTFSELYALLENSDNITLNKSYKYDVNWDGLINAARITDDLYLDANGYTIDALGYPPTALYLFYISENANVVMNNLNIINWGYEIHNQGNLTLMNSNISNFTNEGEYNPSAIHNMGNLNIINSSFYNNHIHDGTTIKNYGNCTILNSSFINNSAKNSFGAILTEDKSNLTVIDSMFINNSGIYGGAIGIPYLGEVNKFIVSNSTFINNKAKNKGGAIYAYGTILNSTFINNSASYGGAIHAFGNVSNCNFINNSASYGGAVSTPSSKYILCINNSNFEGNEASVGGAIYNSNKYLDSYSNESLVHYGHVNTTVINSVFRNNTAYDNSYSNSIYSNGTLELIGNTINKESPEIFIESNTYDDVLGVSFDDDLEASDNVKTSVINSTVYLTVLNNSTHFVEYNQTSLISAKLTDDNENLIYTPNMSFVIGDESVLAYYNNETNLYEVNYTFTDYGSSVVTANFSGANNLQVNSSTFVLGSDSYILSFYEFSNDNITVILKDSTDNPVPFKTLYYAIDGNVSNITLTTDENGLATLSNLNTSTVTFICLGDEYSNGSNISVRFNRNKIATKLSFSNMNTNVTLNGQRTGENFNVTLTDVNGKALANKTIYIGFNGKVYKRTTNETGGVQLQINIGYQSANTFSITFLGDDEYEGTVDCAIIVVNTLNTTLKAAKTTYTYKANAKSKTVKATLKLTNGTVIKGQTISIKINGAIYQATTNSKGVATISIPITKKGTYSATLTFEGNNQFTKSTASIKVKIS